MNGGDFGISGGKLRVNGGDFGVDGAGRVGG